MAENRSVAEDLSAAWDALEEDTTEKDVTPESNKAEAAETPSGEEGKAEVQADQSEESGQDPADTQAPADAAATQEGDSESEQSANADEPEPLEPPSSWPQDQRDQFAQLPREAQEFLVKRHQDMQGDYTRKSQEVAALRPWQEIDQHFEPHRQALAAQGMRPQDYVQRLLAIDRMIAENPAQGIQWLAQQRGVNLSQLTPSSEADEYQDPEIAALKQQVGQLSQTLQGQRQQEQMAATQSVMQQLEAFGNETDESGNPAHPHFNDVLEDMVTIGYGMASRGQRPDLNDLYERAVRANPSTHAKLVEAQRHAALEQERKEARRKAEEAKRAARSVRGGPMSTANVGSEDLSLREQLETLWPG